MTRVKIKNVEILLDDEDVPRVLAHNWWPANGYLERIIPNTSKKRERLSHFVLNYSGPELVDHWDRNVNNYQKFNLRVVNKSTNGFNAKIRVDNTSGVKGVSFNKQVGKWRAYLMKDGKERHLGFFWDKEDAIIARRQAEQLLGIIA